MLIWYHIVFVVRVDWLILQRHNDLFGWELDSREVFEEVGVVRGVSVQICVGRIARLWSAVSMIVRVVH